MATTQRLRRSARYNPCQLGLPLSDRWRRQKHGIGVSSGSARRRSWRQLRRRGSRAPRERRPAEPQLPRLRLEARRPKGTHIRTQLRSPTSDWNGVRTYVTSNPGLIKNDSAPPARMQPSPVRPRTPIRRRSPATASLPRLVLAVTAGAVGARAPPPRVCGRVGGARAWDGREYGRESS